jgi:uncharacterized low-complexity protein
VPYDSNIRSYTIMSNQISKKPVAIAMGAALTGGLLVAGSVNAAANPFGLSELGSGYMQVAEAQCGAKPKVTEEGKCGGAKPAAMPAEGKCGEAKCGANMK